MMKLLFFIYVGFIFADSVDLQSKLIVIASREAQIANIGQNKMMMLYGVSDVFPIIDKWIAIEHKEKLTENQIEQIKAFEQQKFAILKAR